MSDTEKDGHRHIPATARAVLSNSVIRWGFLGVAAGLSIYAVAHQWPQVRGALADLGAPVIVAALCGVGLAMVAAMQVWRTLLSALGSPLSSKASAGIFFVGQLGKYLPGAIWPVLTQMELANARRVPRHRAATASVLTMLYSLCGALLAAILALPFTGPSPGYRAFLLAAPALLAVLHPRVLNPLLRTVTRGRWSVGELRTNTMVRALGWSLLSWLFYGIPIWLLAVRLGAPAARTALIAAGGFAFAWSIGFLVVIAPAGAGIRDVLLVATLTVVLNTPDATAVALVSRLLMTLGDVLAATAAVVLNRNTSEIDNIGPSTDIAVAVQPMPGSGCGSHRPCLDMPAPGESESRHEHTAVRGDGHDPRPAGGTRPRG